MKNTYLTYTTKNLDKQNRIFEAIASTGIKDRMGESIDPNGWDLENYKKNPVLLFAHKYNELPVGKVLDIRKTSEGLYIKGQVVSGIELADQVWTLVENGVLRALSVGFLPRKYNQGEKDNPYDIIEAELLEISFVPVPANPEALIQLGYKEDVINKFVKLIELYQKSIKEKSDKEEFEICGKRDLPIDDEGSWDGDKARDEMKKYAGDDMEKYKNGFVIRDKNHKENLGAYKLPFARVKEGKLVATWGGVLNAMRAVLGARTELKVPEEIKKGAYNFLASYYKRFDKEVPEYKQYTDEEFKKLEERQKDLDLEKKIRKIVKEVLSEVLSEGKENNKYLIKRKILNQIAFHLKQSDKNTNIALQKMKLLNRLKLEIKNSK